jgi:repressor of nif and glnA expression
MPKVEIKDILQELLQKGYFKEGRTISNVIDKLSHRGFTVKGKKVGNVAQMLTKMCQSSENSLERRPIENGKGWKYKEVTNGE